MKPIKVLQVFTVMNRGGAETNAMNYMRAMDRSKVHFDFLVHREEEGAYEKEILELGGKVFRLPAVHPARLGPYKAAVKKFFDENPGYDVIHGQLSELGVFIYEEAKRRGIPVIIAHAHNAPKLSDYDAKFIFRELWKRRMRKSVNARFTCGAEAAGWLFGKKDGQKAFQMNNAINTADFKFKPQIRKEMQHELDLNPEALNIIHVGRFNKQKNHTFLIDIFAEIKKRRPDARLFLVGNGDLQQEIADKVKALNLENEVKFLGLRSDVARLLQGMDIYLFPSLFEGLPVSLVEAQASGIHCVISDTIPAQSVLIPENVTVIPLTENAVSWVDKILKIDVSARKDVSQIIKDRKFDIAQNVKELEEKYRELLNRFS